MQWRAAQAGQWSTKHGTRTITREDYQIIAVYSSIYILIIVPDLIYIYAEGYVIYE